MSEQINHKMLQALKAAQRVVKESLGQTAGIPVVDDAIAEAEASPHAFTPQDQHWGMETCSVCGRASWDPRHAKPRLSDEPTREELIDALRSAVLPNGDLDPAISVLAKCDPKPEHVTWVVDTKTGVWERRRLKVAAKPNQCRRERDGRICQEHCPCVERCCFCEWVQVKHEPRPRRWEVEFPDMPQAELTPGWSSPCATVVRELKPITREQIEEATNKTGFYPAPINTRGMQKAELFLQALGIEVED